MNKKNKLNVFVDEKMYEVFMYIPQIENYLEIADRLIFPIEELGKAYFVEKTEKGILIRNIMGAKR